MELLDTLGSQPLTDADVAAAWRTCGDPHAMVRLLAAAGSADCDTAARIAVETAASQLDDDDAIRELREIAGRPTVCGELADALFVTWCGALADPDRRDELEAEIAARIRDRVRAPSAAQLTPPPRLAAVPTGAAALAELIADPSTLVALESTVPPGSRVISPEGYGRNGPELGGLACERIFGPWWPRTASYDDDRTERWGYIELAVPCPHPIVPKAMLRVLPVVPPHFRHWTLVPVEELKRYAREYRRELEERGGDHGDSPEKVLAEAGLEDPDAITKPGRREHQLDTIYRAFINRDRRARRFVELGAPAVVIEQNAAELASWSKRLVTGWREWITELPADTEPAWALRALACRQR